ncbi:MAG: hypothetical protein AAFX02_02710 [Pseudomonadota bacterium]
MVDYRPHSKKKRRRSKRYITGKEALKLIDGSVSRARSALDDAIRSADETRQRRGEVRKEQVAQFQALAKFRLENLEEETDTSDLTKAERKAAELLDQHAAFIEEEFAALDRLQAKIGELEQDRVAASDKLGTAVEKQSEKIDSVLEKLGETKAWQELKSALDEAAAIVERATQKLEIAKADRDEKGEPYESDPLFSYLWKRKYRTTEYKAGGLIRMLDEWVGKLCGYDKAHLTYARLIELPDRLAEHVEHVTELEADAENALKELETEALTKTGVDKMEAEIETMRQSVRDLDEAVEAAEKQHLERAESHQAALSAETGPAEEARTVLAAALRKMSFPDLRTMVAQTVELEDDRIVDELVRLRAEEMQLEIAIKDDTGLPNRRRDDLRDFEALRSMFKRANYASHRIQMDKAVLEDVLSDLKSGKYDPESALKRIRKTVRRSDEDDWSGGSGGGRHHKRYKSRRRRHRYGGWDTPYGNAAGDIGTIVAWELAKAALGGKRGGGGGGGIDLGDIGGDDWFTGGGF